MNIQGRTMHALGAIFALGLSILLLTSTFMSSAAPSADLQPGLPVRAAFYYPWFPEAWKQQGIEPYTNYHPSLGFYSLSDQTMVRQHIDAMQYGGIQVGIASWWGQGSATDQRLPLLLTAAAPTTFRWSIYYEPESQGDPSLSTLSADLTYLRYHYGSDPSLLRIDGRLVVFVYADASDGCGMVERWTQANSVNAYLVLKVFAGYRSCARQPDGWHQYAPACADEPSNDTRRNDPYVHRERRHASGTSPSRHKLWWLSLATCYQWEYYKHRKLPALYSGQRFRNTPERKVARLCNQQWHY